MSTTTICEVGDDYGQTFRITKDGYGYTVQQKTKRLDKDGQPTWINLPRPHWSSFEGACRRVLEEGLRAADTWQVGLLMQSMERWATQVAEAARGAST